MPYSAAHRAKTRARITQAAREAFNTHGYDGASIKDIMQAAGLSHGGFYHHFNGKVDLFAEAVASYRGALDAQLSAPDAPQGPALIAAILDGYLSDEHLNGPETSCPMIAVPSDVARGNEAAKQAFQSVFGTMLTTFEANQNGTPRATAREIAMTLAMINIGGMVIARALADPDLAQELRQTAKRAPDLLGLPGV